MGRGHLLRGVAKDEARRGGMGVEEGDDFGGMLGVGFLEEPADAFLDEVLGVGEEWFGDAEDDVEIAAVLGFLDERNGGGAALPLVGRLGPSVEFGE